MIAGVQLHNYRFLSLLVCNIGIIEWILCWCAKDYVIEYDFCLLCNIIIIDSQFCLCAI